MDDDTALTREQQARLALIAETFSEDDIQRLAKVANFYRDWEGFGRLGSYLKVIASWAVVIAAGWTLLKSGLIGFLGKGP